MTIEEWMKKEDVLTTSGYDTVGKTVVILTNDEFANVYWESEAFQKFCEKTIPLEEEEANSFAFPPPESDPLWARIKRTVGIVDDDEETEE
ncbi:MAG: hypothetical protein E7390_02015 [Ruminococcaceae bacterium]|nr:hypothetical protein [Oscillospiraceae bacterium]